MSTSFPRPSGTSAMPFLFLAAVQVLLVPLLEAQEEDPGEPQIEVELVWEIGTVNGPAETIWDYIMDATIVDGAVYAVDIRLQTVRGFSVAGEYLGELGRVGQGPGEFAQPISVTVVNDTLWIYDVTLDRWAIFDHDGRHVRTERTGSGYSPLAFLNRLWPGRNDQWIGMTGLVQRSRPSQSVDDHYVLSWDDSGVVDTLAVIPGNPYWTERDWTDSLVMSPTESLGPSGGAWVLGDSLLALVVGTEALLYQLEERPKLTHRSRLPGASRPITEAEAELAARAYYRTYGLDPEESSTTGFVLPEQWAPWTRVLGDDEGNLWLRRGGPELVDPTQGERWVRWRIGSGERDEVLIPPGVEALRFRDGYMVGMGYGTLGTQRLYLYRLRERAR